MEKDTLQAQLDRELATHVFHSREDSPVHFYDKEQQLLSCVRHGDMEKLAERAPLNIPKVQGPSVHDAHRKLLYDMVALITLITRAAIDGGMHIETAYTLSDLYIRQLDKAPNLNELIELGRKALRDFTMKVSTSKKADLAKSLPVRRCIWFVRSHLHEKHTLSRAAQFVGLSDKYLSRLFLKQTGQKFHEFVQTEKISEARRLLAHTEMSIRDISNTLSFSSQSYFTKVFSQHSGFTPEKYRKNFI